MPVCVCSPFVSLFKSFCQFCVSSRLQQSSACLSNFKKGDYKPTCEPLTYFHCWTTIKETITLLSLVEFGVWMSDVWQLTYLFSCRNTWASLSPAWRSRIWPRLRGLSCFLSRSASAPGWTHAVRQETSVRDHIDNNHLNHPAHRLSI